MARTGSTPPEEVAVDYEWLSVDETGFGTWEVHVLLAWQEGGATRHASSVVEASPEDTMEEINQRALDAVQGS